MSSSRDPREDWMVSYIDDLLMDANEDVTEKGQEFDEVEAPPLPEDSDLTVTKEENSNYQDGENRENKIEQSLPSKISSEKSQSKTAEIKSSLIEKSTVEITPFASTSKTETNEVSHSVTDNLISQDQRVPEVPQSPPASSSEKPSSIPATKPPVSSVGASLQKYNGGDNTSTISSVAQERKTTPRFVQPSVDNIYPDKNSATRSVDREQRAADQDSKSSSFRPQPEEHLARKHSLEKLLRDSVLKSTVKTKDIPKTNAPEPAVVVNPTVGSIGPTLLKNRHEPLVVPANTPSVAPDNSTSTSTIEDTGSNIATDSRANVINREWIDGRPPWAQNRFDVLLFSVSKLTLGVPLIALGQIQKLSEELTPLFGQVDWFMGLLPTAQGKIRCVDTALFVMPDRYQPSFKDNYRFVITIDGLNWGLAVDEVKQPIQLDPDSVNWRGQRSKRPWLAGTIKEHMCALLDVPVLGDILAEQDKNKPR